MLIRHPSAASTVGQLAAACVKQADREDKLLHHMQSKGNMSKGKAVRIAKSRGWVRQSGRHLELTSKGEGPRHNVDVPESKEKHSAAGTLGVEAAKLANALLGYDTPNMGSGVAQPQMQLGGAGGSAGVPTVQPMNYMGPPAGNEFQAAMYGKH